ncbi:MAG: imidazolonepropionase [Polyangiaceae bacterium]|nr:imidazolonepropionase [Polyangiaceae bacterium]
MFAIVAKRLVTCDPNWATAENPLGVIEHGAVVVDGERIVDVLPREELFARFPHIEVSADLDRHEIGTPALVTPGLVDAHTHAPWMGSRDGEYAMRMAGAGYEEIAAAGGGIVSSMRAIRTADVSDIERTLLARVRRMMSLGVTTIECKSGYGLDLESERKQLDAVKRVSVCPDVPRLVPTYLALHAVPPEARADRAAYVRDVESISVPTIAAENLARYVDVYVDRAAFSVSEARPVLRCALDAGLGVRLHVGQFADVGGAELAAELGAASVDHVEHIGAAGIDALARASVSVVLLPTASLTLGQTPPPVDAFRKAGIPLVVASDANPGTAPTESLPLAMAIAVRTYGLSVAETILGVTSRAAASLGLGAECGMIRKGFRADMVLWDLPHENAIVQPWGVSRAVSVYRDGRSIHSC